MEFETAVHNLLHQRDTKAYMDLYTLIYNRRSMSDSWRGTDLCKVARMLHKILHKHTVDVSLASVRRGDIQDKTQFVRSIRAAVKAALGPFMTPCDDLGSDPWYRLVKGVMFRLILGASVFWDKLFAHCNTILLRAWCGIQICDNIHARLLQRA
jgi:hypothetical protein